MFWILKFFFIHRYGYQNPNQHDQQATYTFSKPKYEYYPYSQHDIPPSTEYREDQNQLNYLRHYPQALSSGSSNYYPESPRTSVEIQPSHSYEIKQTEHGYKTIYHGNGDHAPSNYGHGHSEIAAPSAEQVPVIVLRVPGPAKYASHLQTLLQQYLEERAAQYIQSLQEEEARAHQGVQHSEEHSHQPDLSSYGALPVLPYAQHQAYLPAQMFIQPLQQIQPYYAQLPNPYANAHITQSIEVGDDHISAEPAPAPAPINYYSHQHLGGTDQHTGEKIHYISNQRKTLNLS